MRGDSAAGGKLPKFGRVLLLDGVVVSPDHGDALETEVGPCGGCDAGRERGGAGDGAVCVEGHLDDLGGVLVGDGELARSERGDALEVEGVSGNVEGVHERVVLVRGAGDLVHLAVAVVHDEDVARFRIVSSAGEVGLRARQLVAGLGSLAEALEWGHGEPLVADRGGVRRRGQEQRHGGENELHDGVAGRSTRRSRRAAHAISGRETPRPPTSDSRIFRNCQQNCRNIQEKAGYSRKSAIFSPSPPARLRAHLTQKTRRVRCPFLSCDRFIVAFPIDVSLVSSALTIVIDRRAAWDAADPM